MRSRRTRRTVSYLITAILLFQMLAQTVTAIPAPVEDRDLAVAPATDAFQRTWARTDQPVAQSQVSRTWMWGPDGNTAGMWEQYTQSPGGERQVQYFDKSRMEITYPDREDDGLWYVTNGLLVVELVTGQMQVGNDDFVSRSPAQVNVAGDADDVTGPTYATFTNLRNRDAASEGSQITERVNRNGTVTNDSSLSSRDVRAARYVNETNHTVAAPFWEFMNSSGTVFQNGSNTTAALFQNPFYATGFPITEAYWANVKVANTYKDVLMQCFERRCLTYTPDNDPAWRVEAGNVGQHYYAWRYGSTSERSVSKHIIASEGGTISLDGEVMVNIPPGALANDAIMTIRTVPADDAPSLFGPEVDTAVRFYDISAQGTPLLLPISIGFAAQLSSQDDSYDFHDDVIVHHVASDGRWEAPAKARTEPHTSTTWVEVSHLSFFGYVSPWALLNQTRDLITLRWTSLLKAASAPSCPPESNVIRVDAGSSFGIIGGCVLNDSNPNRPELLLQNTSLYEYRFTSNPTSVGINRVVGPNEWITVSANASNTYPFRIDVSQTPDTELKFAAQFLLGFIPYGGVVDSTRLVDPFIKSLGAHQQIVIRDFRLALEEPSAERVLIALAGLAADPVVIRAMFDALNTVGNETSGLEWLKLGMEVGVALLASMLKAALTATIVKAAPIVAIVQAVLNSLTYGVAFLHARLTDMTVILSGQVPHLTFQYQSHGPSAPTGLVATVLDSTRIKLEWSHNGIEVNKFRVYGSAGTQMVDNIAANARTHTMTGLSPSTEYCLKVAAVSADDIRSNFSNIVCATTHPEPVETCTSTDGYWDVTPYDVSRGDWITVYGWGTMAYGAWTEGQRIDFGFWDWHENWFYLGHGIVGCLDGESWLEVDFMIPHEAASGGAIMIASHGDVETWMPFNILGSGNPPATPTNLELHWADQQEQYYLKWDDNANNEDGYEVWGGTYDSGYIDTYLGSYGPDSWFYWLDWDSGDTWYDCYQVRAYNSSGYSGWSNIVCWEIYVGNSELVFEDRMPLDVAR